MVNTLRATPAFLSFANARFYDLHLLHLIDRQILKDTFVDYVHNNFEPRPTTGQEIEEGAEYLRQYVLQIHWTRAVDSFQRYVVEVLRDVLRAKPDIMASSDAKLNYEEVLKAPDLDSLVGTMIERTVKPLIGLRALESWFEKRKIPLTITAEERKILGEAIATRNIIVHNGAVVNEQYLAEAPWRGFLVGQLRGLSFEELFLVEYLVKTVATNTDSALMKKYGIGAEVPSAAV
jgi:hypothetical protein